ncbi:MAG TPA: hypothetical protein VFW11_16705 [Cyclobacteriaceae bacterium]|nr:hypothetical protein [Cyclobacteriaceae bacterium]
MKILSPALHSALDYLVVVILWTAPFILNLNGLIATLTYSLGAVHLLLTVFTNFPLGIIKIVPLKIHGYIELIVSVVLLTTPLYISKLSAMDSAMDTFFFGGFGVIVFITWLISDYDPCGDAV